jgi:trans-aconitate methyltransferase
MRVGRLSKALRKRFKAGYGIDISPTMIASAKKYVEGVNFIHKNTATLAQWCREVLKGLL